MSVEKPTEETKPRKRGRPVIVDNETVTRILDSAEEVFAEHGYSGASMRAIARGAGVNQALVAYHFENKEGLFRSVVARRAKVVTSQRVERLNAHLNAGSPTVEGVMRALISPSVEMSADEENGGSSFVMIMAALNAATDDRSRTLLQEMFLETADHFIDAFVLLNPRLSRKEAARAYNFAIAVAMTAVTADWRLQRFDDRPCAPEDRIALIVNHAVGFCSHGLSGLDGDD